MFTSFGRTDMARYQVKPREDGRGPYRWSHVVKRHNALRQGTIYTQMGDDLDAQDAAHLQTLCDKAGFEMRRVA
ncbi:Transposase [Litorimonas haliclonae]